MEKTNRLIQLIIILIFFSNPIHVFGYGLQPLPADQAFQLNVRTNNTDSLFADFKIAPGYYLYRDRIHFTLVDPKTASLGSVFMPPGEEKTDAILGKHQIFVSQVSLAVPVLNPSNKPLSLLISYQGCSSSGFCYPPIEKQINLAASMGGLTVSDYSPDHFNTSKVDEFTSSEPISQQDQAQKSLAQGNHLLALLLFLGFGLLLSFTPCVLPMIPIISAIIAGNNGANSARRAFSLSMVYVICMSLTFAVAGIIVASIGNNIQALLQTPWILVSFSILFVLLAFSLFGFYDLALPSAWQSKINTFSQKRHTGTYIGVAIMGCLSTLVVSPCVSAPLVGALAYIGNSGNIWFGGMALFVMGLGMGLPLMIIGTSLGRWLPSAGEWLHLVKHSFGILLLGVAIWLLVRIVPGNIAMFLWGGLALGTGIYLLLSCKRFHNWLRQFSIVIGVLFSVIGGVYMLGATLGHDNLLQPLAKNTVDNNSLPFIQVRSVADVQHALLMAGNKPALLDFYADWCVSCKEMARNVFGDPLVKHKLRNFLLLQADVTNNSADDKALEQYFNVIAPPTVLLFDRTGHELTNSRIIGTMGAKPFLQRIKQVMASNPIVL